MQRVVAAGFLLAALAAAAVSSSSSSSSSVVVASGTGAAFRMQVSHVDAGSGLTQRERLQRMAARSKARAARFLSKARAARARFLSGASSPSSGNLPVVPGLDNPSRQAEYLVSFSIGTPPQDVKLNLDTGSDLMWTQTVPCPACYDQRPMPYFNASRSSTFTLLPCNSSLCQQVLSSCSSHGWPDKNICVYTGAYGDKSVTNGLLATDTFTFPAGGGGAAGLAFGIGFFNQGRTLKFNTTGTGIGGFGRGALSLPSQLKVDNFSYCFTNSTGSAPSPVLLGLPANLYGGGGAAVQTTPLIQSSVTPSYYYLNLTSITVGSTTLPVPASAFALKADGTGGTIMDSGTSFTLLPGHIYNRLLAALVAELKMQPVRRRFGPGLHCFPAAAAARVPKLQLHFEGATLELPRDNFVFEVKNGGQRVVCIAVKSGGQDMTIIGNYQQQNMHMLYDLAGNTLSFVPAQCDTV